MDIFKDVLFKKEKNNRIFFLIADEISTDEMIESKIYIDFYENHFIISERRIFVLNVLVLSVLINLVMKGLPYLIGL